jgi:predicted oxidoreductase (fatty acid repression mutant protein)
MSKKSYKNMMNSRKRFDDLAPMYRKMVTNESSVFNSSINRRVTLIKEDKDINGKMIITEKRVITIHPLCTDKNHEIAKAYDSKLLTD